MNIKEVDQAEVNPILEGIGLVLSAVIAIFGLFYLICMMMFPSYSSCVMPDDILNEYFHFIAVSQVNYWFNLGIIALAIITIPTFIGRKSISKRIRNIVIRSIIAIDALALVACAYFQVNVPPLPMCFS